MLIGFMKCSLILKLHIYLTTGKLLRGFDPVYPKSLWIDTKTFCNGLPFHMVFDKEVGQTCGQALSLHKPQNISFCFDCPTVPCCMCSVCSVHSLTGFAEVLCTETCSLSLQIGISFEVSMTETSADMPARFIAAVHLLPNSEQNFLRFLVTFLSLHIPEPCPMALHFHFPLSSQLLICPTAGRALLAAPCAS